jgi:hypothetical protein
VRGRAGDLETYIELGGIEMAQPYRSTVTIDGTKFGAVSTSVVFKSAKDLAGMSEMGSLVTSIRVWVDFHDDTNMPFDTLKKLFDLANVVTREKTKDMKIEFWKDDSHEDALGCYQFKGWISRFETTNGLPSQVGQSGVGGPAGESSSVVGINHLLVLDLEPALNQQNFKEIKFTN